MARIARKVWNPAAGWIGAGAAGVLVAVSAPAAAEPGPGGETGSHEPPLVGVSLSGIEGEAEPGQEVEFRVTVANSDREPVERALLAQHLPEDVEIVSAGREGVVEQNIANWVVDVPAGEDAEYTLTARLGEDVHPGRQLGSTACLLLEREAEPAACATERVSVAEEAPIAKLAGAVDGPGVLRVSGAGLLVLLLWMFWRRREVSPAR